ncbi:hypothetical protein RS130_10590 [Paraglaciecola aquimarina]|uniref:Uncharacterized protein n=1 Tax=Paraglaciecola aquimarina TaxID=1235557 RepID=A0ABU3SWE9_9ALTE|nr:hypothetical protein [Paraglaciecola aquimarina]MDU0354318.1 hypothetical protein [Paraglaciecola aquimarina]
MLNGKAKAADYEHQFNLFLDGDGLSTGNIPESQSDYISNPGRMANGGLLSDLGTASFTWSETGNPVPSDYLLFGNRILDRQRDGDFFSTEFNVTGELSSGDFEHTVNIGTFFIHAQQMDYNIISSYLADFSDGKNARLVDLSFRDSAGNEVFYSKNGVTGPDVLVIQTKT